MPLALAILKEPDHDFSCVLFQYSGFLDQTLLYQLLLNTPSGFPSHLELSTKQLSRSVLSQ